MTTTMTAAYTPSTHAIERARVRFGVSPANVSEWINEVMTTAVYVASSGDKNAIYEYDGARFIVDTTNNIIVTIHHAISTAFMKPVIERELRKLRRIHVTSIRRHELTYATLLQEYAEKAVNRANARNPNTRTPIGEQMDEIQARIDEVVTKIEREEEEYDDKKRAMELISE